MLKKIAILTLVLAQVLSTQAQNIKFGVHVDPFISFMDSDFSHVLGDAVNGGAALGVEVEYRFNDEGNYALTFGADFSINNGGSLLYRYGGVLFKNTDLENRSSFVDAAGNVPASGASMDIQSFTKVNYRINYVQIPIGLKLRTNELGGSFMRAFFHIPLVKIMIPATAGAKIFTPGAVASSASGYVVDQIGSGVMSSNDGFVLEPNIWKDITPIQIGLGAGAGVEFTPDQENGLRLYAGIYYETGVIDVTAGFEGKTDFRAASTTSGIEGELQQKNPRNSSHTISLRIGVIF